MNDLRKLRKSNEETGGSEPADNAPEPANNAPESADNTPEPADNAPEPADNAPESADNTPEPADYAPEPADNAPEMVSAYENEASDSFDRNEDNITERDSYDDQATNDVLGSVQADEATNIVENHQSETVHSLLTDEESQSQEAVSQPEPCKIKNEVQVDNLLKNYDWGVPPEGISERNAYFAEVVDKKLDLTDLKIEKIYRHLTEVESGYESKIRKLEEERTNLKSEYDVYYKLSQELNKRLQEQEAEAEAKNSQITPYIDVFKGSLPEAVSIERIQSLVTSGSESLNDERARYRLVWRILPALMQILGEGLADELDAKTLVSVAEKFSEEVCKMFQNNESAISDWHTLANEHLEANGYTFIVLSVGAPIDVNLMTGSIQGKSKIESIKRMPLTKDEKVLRKADVSGI